jgi:short chain dehydrogenase
VTPERPEPGLPPLRLLIVAAVIGGVIGAAFLRRSAHYRRAVRSVDALHDRVVLISGGVRGLGFLLAREYGRWGAQVWIVSPSAEDAARAETDLRALGIDAHSVVADIGDPSAVSALVGQVISVAGRIDVLVNEVGAMEATPPELLTREVLPHMQRQGGGRVVNVPSIGSRSARRAASRIVWATARRRARVTLGWQAHTADVFDALALAEDVSPTVAAGEER